ncbi:MAG TPA: phenylalanine--tRNA ligase beta subunit-related protein [Streptosporangiaceae bacterium]|nr:phenylalanine--tRNA ligase beta subunit-related protein [Streptosporangiaceae bacterium]
MADADRWRDWLDRAVVEESVRELRPDYLALIVVAAGLRPGPSDAATDALLAEAETEAKAALAAAGSEAGAGSGGTGAGDLPAVADWRLAYQAFGAKPKRTRPSVEALLRRVDTGLPRIDRLTDVYNAISVKHLLPAGGEDLDEYVGHARLTRAKGDEPFDTTKDGEPVIDYPEPGEVIWRDDAGVTCRCWNWRQCRRTRITGSTTTAVFILDGLAALGKDGLLAAGAELAGHLGRLHPDASLITRLIGAGQ